uniref:Uncharacterized protein n=1 Tax=Acrobeloides nanus TaxID=290746 RepID=A0A914CEJ4_9BILA
MFWQLANQDRGYTIWCKTFTVLMIGFPCAFSCGVIVFALGIFFNIKLYRLLRQNQQHITPETRKMQMTLYRTYTIS